LAKAVSDGAGVERLILRDCKIREITPLTQLLGKGGSVSGLTYLDLSMSRRDPDTENLMKVAQALKSNTTLMQLAIGTAPHKKKLSDDVVKELGEALATNTTLQMLYLDNAVTPEQCEYLQKCLATNTTLQGVRILPPDEELSFKGKWLREPPDVG